MSMRLLILAAVGILTSCGPNSASDGTLKGLIGPDNRTVSGNDIVGIINTPNGQCTGTPYGLFEVYTAAHCVEEAEPEDVTFSNNGIDYTAAAISHSIVQDLAFITLKKPLNRFFVEAEPTDYKNLSLLGYDGNSKTTVATDTGEAKPLPEYPGLLEHNFDSTAMASGGPLLQDGKLIGIHLGFQADENRNIALQLSAKDKVISKPSYRAEGCTLTDWSGCNISDVGEGIGDAIEGVIGAAGCVEAAVLASRRISMVFSDYYNDLSRKGHRIPVPACLHTIVRDDYGLDPHWVEVRGDINATPDSNTAITLENKIFFPPSIKSETDIKNNLKWFLHELEHVVQWKKKGRNDFITEYVCDTGKEIFSFNWDSINIHDSLRIEESAEAKANNLIEKASLACREPGLTKRSVRAVDVGSDWIISNEKINSAGNAIWSYRRSTKDFRLADGVAIAIGGSKESPLVVNNGNDIFRWANGSGWTPLPGKARDVGHGWIIGVDKIGSDDYGIYKWTGNTWAKVSGHAVRIGTNLSNPLVLNAGGSIYSWNGSGWTQRPGSARDVGDDWVIGQIPTGGDNFSIHRWNGTDWDRMPGGAVRIGGTKAVPLVVNAGGDVYRWNGSDWEKI